MPQVRRHNLPPALLQHLLDRIQQRQITAGQLGALVDWLDRGPEVPKELLTQRTRRTERGEIRD